MNHQDREDQEEVIDLINLILLFFFQLIFYLG